MFMVEAEANSLKYSSEQKPIVQDVGAEYLDPMQELDATLARTIGAVSENAFFDHSNDVEINEYTLDIDVPACSSGLIENQPYIAKSRTVHTEDGKEQQVVTLTNIPNEKAKFCHGISKINVILPNSSTDGKAENIKLLWYQLPNTIHFKNWNIQEMCHNKVMNSPITGTSMELAVGECYDATDNIVDLSYIDNNGNKVFVSIESVGPSFLWIVDDSGMLPHGPSIIDFDLALLQAVQDNNLPESTGASWFDFNSPKEIDAGIVIVQSDFPLTDEQIKKVGPIIETATPTPTPYPESTPTPSMVEVQVGDGTTALVPSEQAYELIPTGEKNLSTVQGTAIKDLYVQRILSTDPAKDTAQRLVMDVLQNTASDPVTIQDSVKALKAKNQEKLLFKIKNFFQGFVDARKIPPPEVEDAVIPANTSLEVVVMRRIDNQVYAIVTDGQNNYIYETSTAKFSDNLNFYVYNNTTGQIDTPTSNSLESGMDGRVTIVSSSYQSSIYAKSNSQSDLVSYADSLGDTESTFNPEGSFYYDGQLHTISLPPGLTGEFFGVLPDGRVGIRVRTSENFNLDSLASDNFFVKFPGEMIIWTDLNTIASKPWSPSKLFPTPMQNPVVTPQQ